MGISIFYWISTGLLSLLYLASAALYLAKPQFVRTAQAELGYSAAYLVPFMVAIKIAAPLVIVSRFSVALSDLAYAGMLFHLGLAAMAHVGAGKAKGAVPALLGLLFLAGSFMTQNAVRGTLSPYVDAFSLPALLG